MRRTVLVAALAWGCSGSGGGQAKSGGDAESFPDAPRVKAAHDKWCAALDKLGEQGRWSYQKECAAATPTASAEFLERLTACFHKQLEDLGDQAPDGRTMLTTCTDEILYNADPGDLSQHPLVQARCDRTARCEKSSVEECIAAFQRLEAAQRAVFVSMYNARAQRDIAECLEEKDCAADEDAAREACYQPAHDARVWTPF